MNDSQHLLEDIATQVRSCQKCPLHRGRHHAVPGEGPPGAELMFIGEGPGFQEDKQGRPFVGPSGNLLESLLARIGFRREQVYIANVIKCRPPNNRDPLPQEIEACTPYLQRQIALVDPLLIITLGRFSMAQFLAASARITREHGQPHEVDGRMVIPMFHPAAALRNPQWHRDMIFDFAQIPKHLAAARAARADDDPEDFQQLSLF